MPNRLGPNRLSPPFSPVWQIAHCRTNAALPLAASPSAWAAPVRQARASAPTANVPWAAPFRIAVVFSPPRRLPLNMLPPAHSLFVILPAPDGPQYDPCL